MPATRDDLLVLAERALELAEEGEAQATAWSERQHSSGPAGAVTSEAVSVEVAVVLDEWSSWRAAAARTAIASTRGVRAYEERSFGELRVRRHGEPGRSLELSATAVSPSELDPVALGAEADRLLGGGEDRVAGVDASEYAVVLGHWAVAEVLRRVALSFGGPWSPVADRVGTRVAASAVNLSESPRFAATLPRSYDAEGSPQQPLPLIQDGVAHRVAGAGTGHALGPGGIGGGAPPPPPPAAG